jgi:hypothetical protein
MKEKWNAFVQTKTYKSIRTILKVFVAGCVTYLVSNGLGITSANYRELGLAGATAVLVWLVNALNPGYTDYGVGAGE